MFKAPPGFIVVYRNVAHVSERIDRPIYYKCAIPVSTIMSIIEGCGVAPFPSIGNTEITWFDGVKINKFWPDQTLEEIADLMMEASPYNGI